MIKELEKTMKVFEKLNDYVNKEIVSLEVFKEEYENIQDLNELDKEVNAILLALNTDDFLDAFETLEQICFLDMKLSTYTWHIEQMSDLTEKFIGLYREKVFWTQVEL